MSRDPISRSIRLIDSMGVYRAYEAWPSYAEQSLRQRAEIEGRFERVIFLAVGGSAAAGDIISDWLTMCGGPEFSVFKGVLPDANLDRALVIACSTSGNTEETIEVAKRAAKRGATMVTISGGGKLRQLAKRGAVHIEIPIAMAPRYTLPNTLFATLAILRESGLLGTLANELDDGVGSMRKMGREIATTVPESKNPAKKIARALVLSTPQIYGSSLTRGIVFRFKNSLNENAKMHAHADSTPELFHNEVESWDKGGAGLVPIIVRHKYEPQRDRERLEMFIELLRTKEISPIEVRGDGSTRLGLLTSLMYKLDFASYYAAVLRRIDPYPIPTIDRLKFG